MALRPGPARQPTLGDTAIARRQSKRMGHRNQPMKVSIVVPVFNEEGNLEEFLRRLTAVMDASGRPYEVIAVDDGDW